MVEFLNRQPAPFRQLANITFCLNYKTEFGQAIAVVGEIAKLGEWSDFHPGCMKWHDGDNWRLTIRGVQSDKPF